MTDRFFKRLTPTVPGEPGAFLISSQGKVVTGFVSGGPTVGLGFPQWAGAGHSAIHYFREVRATGWTQSLCGRVDHLATSLLALRNKWWKRA